MEYLDHIFVTTDEEFVEPIRGKVHTSLESAQAVTGDNVIILTLYEFLSRFPRHIFVL